MPDDKNGTPTTKKRCAALSGDGHRCRLDQGHESVTLGGVKQRPGTTRHLTEDRRTFATVDEHVDDGAIAEVIDLVEATIGRYGARAVHQFGAWLKRRLGGAA